MKITKEHVGKKIVWVGRRGILTINAVGMSSFLASSSQYSDEAEMCYSCEGDYEPLPDPKPQVAEAFLRSTGSKRWWLSCNLYQSQEEAEAEYRGCQVVWPALIDPNTGMYTLPED